jgi:quercetin dioxygenase-like cupin family protein
MKYVSRQELASDVATGEDGIPGLSLTWLQGPHTNDELDVGIAHVQPGASTPAHVHHKGQVIVTVHGRGYVQKASGERIETSAGDVVICPAGEAHTHGSVGDERWSHLTITTGTHGVGE